MAKKHGAVPVEEACRVAMDLGAPQYRFVRRWIERHPPVPVTPPTPWTPQHTDSARLAPKAKLTHPGEQSRRIVD